MFLSSTSVSADKTALPFDTEHAFFSFFAVRRTCTTRLICSCQAFASTQMMIERPHRVNAGQGLALSKLLLHSSCRCTARSYH